jgi:hypothetical protein
LETQVLIAQRLRFVTQERADTLLAQILEVGRILGGLIASL